MSNIPESYRALSLSATRLRPSLGRGALFEQLLELRTEIRYWVQIDILVAETISGKWRLERRSWPCGPRASSRSEKPSLDTSSGCSMGRSSSSGRSNLPNLPGRISMRLTPALRAGRRSPVHKMAVLILQTLWGALGLDDPAKLDLASRCFFLGRGVEETRRILQGYDPKEADDVIEISSLSGYDVIKHGPVH